MNFIHHLPYLKLIIIFVFGFNVLHAQVSFIGPEIQVNTSTTNSQAYPDIARAQDGKIYTAWHSLAQDGDDFGIYAQAFLANSSTKGTEYRVNSTTSLGQRNPAIATDKDGNTIVCWMSDKTDGDGYGIYYRQYDSSGTALRSERRANSTSAGHQRFPQVGADENFNFVIVWEDELLDGDDWGIFFRRYNNAGSALASPVQANTTSAGSQHFPDIAVGPQGAFAIVWQGENAQGNYDIYAQLYDSLGVAIGTETRVNSTTSGNQIDPKVAMDELGNIAIVWTSEGQDGDAEGVYACLLDATGQRVLSEFRVNVATLGAQNHADVSFIKDGAILICWNSFGQDGDADGCYANAFNSKGVPVSTTDILINTTTTHYQKFPKIASTYQSDSVAIIWQSGGRNLTTTQDGDDYGIFMRYAQVQVPAALQASCLQQTTDIFLDTAGLASIAVAVIDSGSTFSGSLSISPSSFGCIDVGVQTVSLTATDGLGRSSFCNAQVQVLDSIAPQAVCRQSPITIVLDSTGIALLSTSQLDSASFDNCSFISFGLSQDSVTCQDLSPLTVLLDVSDPSGNMDACSVQIQIDDAAALPQLLSPADLTTCGDSLLFPSLSTTASPQAADFSWMYEFPAPIGISQVGNGQILPTLLPFNTGDTAVIGTVVWRAISTAGCESNPDSFEISLGVTPGDIPSDSLRLCSGDTLGLILQANNAASFDLLDRTASSFAEVQSAFQTFPSTGLSSSDLSQDTLFNLDTSMTIQQVIYRVRAISGDGCASLSVTDVVVEIESCTMNIDPVLAQYTWRVYPIPARESFTVEVDFPLGKEWRCGLSDIHGKMLWERPLKEQATSFSTTGLAAGIYVLWIGNRGGDRLIRRIMVE